MYREIWANRPFRVLFVSRTLAILADSLRIVALSVVVYTATGSPAMAAMTYGISFLPQLAGSSLLGALTDRIRPRPLIACGYAAEATAAAAMALLPLPVWACLTLLATLALVTPVFDGASSRVVAEVLTGDAYVLGRSMSSLASSAAQLLGMAGAGLAVAAFDARHALLITAGSHAAAAFWVRLRLADLPVVGGAGEGSAVRQSWAGNLALLRDGHIRELLLAQWIPPALFCGAEALIVPFAAERHFPPGTAGWLMAAVPIGMIAGNLVVGRLMRPAVRERLVPVLVVTMGAPCLAFLAPLRWPAVFAVLVVAGAGFVYSLGLQRQFRDAVVPERRGQAFSLLGTGLMTAQGLCPAVSGLAAQFVPAALVIAVLGGATIVVAALLALLVKQVPQVYRPAT